MKGRIYYRYLMILGFIFFSGITYAEEEASFSVYEKYSSIGLYIGSVSGIGLSYRYHFPNPWLFQITGGLIYIEEDYAYSLGLEGQYELTKSNIARFYVMGAGGIYGSQTQSDGDTESTTTLHFGFGIGGEIAFGPTIVNHLTLGINFFPIALHVKENDSSIFPGASIYLYYNW